MSNTYPLGGKRAFTLIEMLVVVAIISVVATASVSSIKSAQRQARSAKCQANMHALYNAAAAYHADKGHWPAAGAYELYDSRGDYFLHYRGWVNWVLSGSKRARPGDNDNPYKDGKNNRDGHKESSQAAKLVYVGTGAANSDAPGNKIPDSRVYRSIDEGAIFRYADKNFAAYCCDEFKSKFGKGSMRSYAMNQVFGCRRHRLYPPPKELPDGADADRLAMFVELDSVGKSSASSKAGTSGDEKEPTNIFSDDSVWDWDGKSGSGSDGNSGENIGVLHKKSGKIYGHVVFADGHLESLVLPADKTQQQKQRRSLGKGELYVK